MNTDVSVNGKTSMADQRQGAIGGHFGLLFPTDYVKACDLKSRDVTVSIDHLEYEVLQMQGGKKERKVVAYLRAVGKDGKPGALLGKRLVMNKTNMKSVAKVAGDPDVSKWAGVKVTLWPTMCRGADGSQVECIRVRVRTNASAAEVPDEMSVAPDPRPAFADEANAGDTAGVSS